MLIREKEMIRWENLIIEYDFAKKGRNMSRTKAILFDLDGTLWDSTEGILKAWNGILEKHTELKRGPLTLEELGSYLGLPMTGIADRMLSECEEPHRTEVMKECMDSENDYLYEYGGILYPELEKTLAILKEDYQLFVVSNCQSGYIESFLHAHKLEKYFDDFTCWGDNPVPKGENNKLIIQKNNIEKALYVGDTAGDEESARVAGIPFVFAEYGFGKAVAPDYVVTSFDQLPELMKKVL